jgi:CRISPR-associated protein Csd1
MVDKGDYVFGVPLKGKSQEWAGRTHAAWVALVGEAAEATRDPDVEAINRFVTGHVQEVSIPEDYDAAKFVAIFVNGRFPVGSQVVQRWWASRQLGRDTAAGSVHERQCAVCGDRGEPVENLPVQIRGLTSIGGRAGMGLVTGNSDVFERHGMKRAAGASLCRSCGERSHRALNALISDPVRSRAIGETKVLWWVTEPCDDLIGAVVAGDTDETVAKLFDVLRRGGRSSVPDSAKFYSVTLGANVNRVVVRDWVDTSLAEVVEHVSRWLDAVEIVDHSGMTTRFPGIFALLSGIAPPGRGSPLSRISPLLAERVLNSALMHSDLPLSLLTLCLLRIRAEQGRITVPRASLLRACLANRNPEEAPMTMLDLESTDVPYRCGRLLAVLDSAARAATSARNDLVDRSYAAASTTPASTFPRLLKLFRAHVNKLRRDRPGVAYRVQAQVEEVLQGVSDLPAMFGPSEQARFALGLYHQKAADRARMSAHATAKANEETDANKQEDANNDDD